MVDLWLGEPLQLAGTLMKHFLEGIAPLPKKLTEVCHQISLLLDEERVY